MKKQILIWFKNKINLSREGCFKKRIKHRNIDCTINQTFLAFIPHETLANNRIFMLKS